MGSLSEMDAFHLQAKLARLYYSKVRTSLFRMCSLRIINFTTILTDKRIYMAVRETANFKINLFTGILRVLTFILPPFLIGEFQ